MSDVQTQPIRLELTGARLRLGRGPESDVVVDDPRASWAHAEITAEPAGAVLRDLGSSNGTWVDGQPVGPAGVVLRPGSKLTIGARTFVFAAAGARTTLGTDELVAAQQAAGLGGGGHAGSRFRRVPLGNGLRIGRAPTNDLVLDEPNVSWEHATLTPSPHGPVVQDLGSRNGTRAGTGFVKSATLGPDDEVGVGPFTLTVRDGTVTVVDTRGGLSLRARGVGVAVKAKTILHPTSLTVNPGELVALIGESGSGKTTLLKTLAGVAQPTHGEILLDEDNVVLRLTDVGYVPQSDTVHEQLAVREALTYAAKLRLPSDTRGPELAAAVDQALAELRLTEHAETRIGSLSGGQRKRCAVAAELIGQPTMLLLDEPTSGLDPGLERRLMELLRRLADDGRGVVVVTHATSSLALCDTVAVMGRGGHLQFLGSPDDALQHFGVSSYDEIYAALEAAPPTHAPTGGAPVRARRVKPPGGALAGRSLVRQSRVLTVRYAKTTLRDARTLAVLMGQVPIIAVAVATLFGSGLLQRPDAQPDRSAQFVFLLVTAALWLGLIASCREVVKERAIVLRELSVGVRLDAYLLSKTTVLFTLTAIQVVLLCAVALVLQPLHVGWEAYLGVGAVLILTAWAATGMGLAVSVLARSVDQSTSFVPLLLIPQLLYAGALIPVDQMPYAVSGLADAVFARWSFAGAGHAIDLNARFAEDPRFAAVNGYGPDFFGASTGAHLIVLAGFTAGFVLLCAVVLARRLRKPE